ncbi:VOC family protein [Roseibium porphyridii]|uniref:VOC family protein n=1 Tax=Roseibium porphyridii TaxID=2866279 RepID=A0ABY8EZU7_9HYPH|nr:MULTISPECIES: VOC family protein [Stappiaceae]QFT33142.1 Glyoxalase-like domain protein [Labrenzia sp. THAF82]WFE88431.1 VOC family protein [Roseibium sp. KMA01]
MTFVPDNFTVWMEIPVTDLDKAISFYNDVFKTELKLVTDMGPNHIAMFTTNKQDGIAGHLYPGKPAGDGSGPTVHIACPDTLEETMERFAKAGGEVVSDPIAIPAGRFAYCIDPDGNSIGLFAA